MSIVTQKKTVVVGASRKPDRYSNKAIKMLVEHGHPVIPVHPKYATIEGLNVAHRLSDVAGPIDTVTLYIGPAESSKLAADLIALKPRRVIMNPGAENDALIAPLEAEGIAVEKACTLVLLRTQQY
ncbi:MAG: CoA-binding protein [Pseudomonadota bacterium]